METTDPTFENDRSGEDLSPAGRHGKKRKVRIKYRQRIKLKSRQKGSGTKLLWKKVTKNLKAILVISGVILVLGTVLYVFVVIGNDHSEAKRLRWNQQWYDLQKNK